MHFSPQQINTQFDTFIFSKIYNRFKQRALRR